MLKAQLGTNVRPGLWSAAEVQIGVFSANLPSLSVFFRSLWYSKKNRSSGSDSEAALSKEAHRNGSGSGKATHSSSLIL